MKKVSRPQYQRVRIILNMIREGTVNGKLTNAGDYCREFGVSRRTIMRDIEMIRDDLRAPIEYRPDRHGYLMTDLSWEIPSIEVNREEIFAFSIAEKLMRAFKGTPLESEMKSVFDKISQSLYGRSEMDISILTDHLSVMGDDYVPIEKDLWRKIARHLDAHRQIKIRYQKFNGEVKSYILNPYHLIAFHGNWYLLAHHVKRQRPATFAISRIRKLEVTGEYFSVPAGFDRNAYIQNAFGISGGDDVMEVKLRFTAKVATYIQERKWHSSQQCFNLDNGDVELSMCVSGRKELIRWILSWQPDCIVLEPEHLRSRVRELMQQALSRPVNDFGN